MLLMTANFSALSSFFKLIGLLILLIVLLFAASFVSNGMPGRCQVRNMQEILRLLKHIPLVREK